MASLEPPYQDEPQQNPLQEDSSNLPDAPLPSSATNHGSASNSATNATPISGGPKWLTYAIASGVCAATNGVFAKLTTTTSTQTLATSLAHLLGFAHAISIVEVVLRSFFFSLNLLSNATMWFLFTRALTLATSTTRVAVLNTSANFLATAALGMAVFGEILPVRWWCGAALLVGGCVVIGRRDEGSKNGKEIKVETDARTQIRAEGGDVLDKPKMYKDNDDQDEEHEFAQPYAGEEGKTTNEQVANKVKTHTDTDEVNEEEVWRSK